MEARPARQCNENPAGEWSGFDPNSATSTSVSWPGGLDREVVCETLPGYAFPHWRWLGWRALAALLGGLILRLWMFSAFPQTGGDADIYGGIAKNILLHGQMALTDSSGVLHLTLIRLPGYPLFLAACFRLFGIDNWTALAWLQIVLELIACLLLADFVRRVASPRAGLNTLWLAAMCPFIAVYSSAPMAESLTFDTICLALWSLERTLDSRHANLTKNEPLRTYSWLWLLLFAFAISSTTLLRPDGALLAVALWPALLFSRGAQPFPKAVQRALLCALLAILPFAAWAIRNWQVFHVFQPLAPRYATDPGESTNPGMQQWTKTWCLDFTCTYYIYWNFPSDPVSFDDLPSSAFDTPAQREQTEQLFNDYNRIHEITPEIDARFAALADERTTVHPLRTWLFLPLGRLADMILRPRVENLPIDLGWWQYDQHHDETKFSIAYGLLNLILLSLGISGFFYRPRFWPYMAAYLILRSLLLMTIEAPESRYTLEFFPILFATGGIALQRVFRRRHGSQPA